MPEIKVEIRYSPDEFRDKILSKIPTRFKNQTMGDMYDSLVEKLVEISGLDEGEAKGYVAGLFLDFLKKEGMLK